MRKVRMRSLSVLATLLWMASLAGSPGGMVGMNLSGGTVGSVDDPPTDVTGPTGASDDIDLYQGHWNNLPDRTGTRTQLVDDSGAVVPGLEVHWISNHTGTGPNPPFFSQDDVLMYAYLDDTQTGTPAGNRTRGCWVSISNVPYSSYHVVIYGSSVDTTPGRPLGGYAVAKPDGRLMSRPVYGGHPYDFDGIWSRIPPHQVDRNEVAANETSLEGNHVVIPHLTDSDILVLGLRSLVGRVGSRASIAGIQIVEASPVDSDADNLPDDWERIHFGNLGFNDTEDPDADLLNNGDEFAQGSNPNLVHSDTDPLTDWEDVRAGFSPILADTSGDGTPDDQAVFNGPDTDGDGLSDPWEGLHFGNLDQGAAGDPDNDGLENVGEQDARTDPNDEDTDGDLLKDGAENNDGIYVDPGRTGSNPLLVDTDSDSLDDGDEVAANPYVTDPNRADTDGDNWRDEIELTLGTNPTDGDDFPVFTPGQFAINFPTANHEVIADGTAPQDFLLMPTESAGAPGFVQTNWNNATIPSGGAAVDLSIHDVRDDAGGVIAEMSVAYTAANTWATDGTVQWVEVDTHGVTNITINGDTRMLGGYLDDGEGGARITLSRIPYPTYDVVVYFTGDGEDSDGLSSYRVEDPLGLLPPLIGSPIYARNLRPQASEYREVARTSVSEATAERGNFTVFRHLREDTLVIVADQGAPGRAPICGIQVISTDPTDYPDADGDGMIDQWELDHFPGMSLTDILPGGDPDLDQLTTLDEFRLATHPDDDDSDNDTLTDGAEVAANTDPNSGDSDSDALADDVETDTGTFVTAHDTGTDPRSSDSDGDGLTDGAEVQVLGTDPTRADSDGDAFTDGFEIQFGSAPTDERDAPPDLVGGAVSFNLREPNPNQVLLASDVAGLIPVTNWNDVVVRNADGGTQPLAPVDDLGTVTPLMMRWSSQAAWGDGDTGTGTPDARIARGFFNDGDTPDPGLAPGNDGGVAGDGIGVSITISDVPYTVYSVILYRSSDAGADGRYGTYTVNGISKTAGATTSFGVLGDWVVDENALVYSDVTGSTLTIRVQSREGSMRGSLAGFQILEMREAIPLGPAIQGMEIRPAGGTYLLSWESTSGKVYRVESVGDPTGGNWMEEVGSPHTASGAQTSHSGPLPAVKANFRVIESPSP